LISYFILIKHSGGGLMGWKKIAESNDLIVFEKNLKDYKIKIEARKTEDYTWEVFKTQIKGENANLISEYFLDNKSQVEKVIERLKKERDLSPKWKILKKALPVKVSLKRIYKEDFVEKWNFFIDNKKIKNFLFVKFDNKINVDIVMHEKYKYYEKSILSQIEEKLGLKELGESVSYEIYYFKKHSSTRARNISNYEYDVNYIDIEFDFSDKD
jgi:hypothetical protein